MPVDGLGSDAGRQSLTEVGAAGARASRRNAAARAQPAEPAPAETRAPGTGPLAPSDRAPKPAWHARGERLVAICALAVLAIAALFFVERIGGLVGAPVPAPFMPPALDLKSLPIEPVTSPPPLEPSAVPGPTTRAAPALAPRVLRASARPRPTPLATTRKPQGKAVASAAPLAEPIVLASAEPWSIEVTGPSRWERMHDEVAACAGQEYFLDAVVSDQRVRHRYCDAWWGRADACPSGRTADYGN